MQKRQNMSGKDAALFMRHTVLDITYTSRTEARRPVRFPVCRSVILCFTKTSRGAAEQLALRETSEFKLVSKCCVSQVAALFPSDTRLNTYNTKHDCNSVHSTDADLKLGSLLIQD